MTHFIDIFDDCRDRHGMHRFNKCLKAKAKAKYLSFEFSSLEPRRRDISAASQLAKTIVYTASIRRNDTGM